MQASASARVSGGASEAFAPFAIGLVVAAALSTVVALVQAFLPDLPDGDLIARSGLPGRAVGNLRQPNHLCSLLLWGVIAVVALMEMRRLAFKWAAALIVLMVFAVELSASRTGAVGLGLLAAWGLLDKRLSRPARVLLVLTPVIYALSYGAMALYGHWTDQAFGAEARIATGEATSESPNSRKRIWANALTLIAQQPWTGVGFGEFNIAWSLTAFPGRPTAFFDHTHNLPLELLVELGVPLGTLVLVLLGVALWQAWKRSCEVTGDAGTAARAAFMLVLMIGLHSMSEYPLWYAYFLLPTAYAWGFALGSRRTPTSDVMGAAPVAGAWRLHASRALGLLLVIGSVYAVFDYLRIAAIYSPGSNAAPLNERIAAGQRSLLFGHHADYAAATSPEPLPGRDLAFQRATHHLLDTRLMQAWAEYLAEKGEVDKARWLAQRLREFRNPASDDFFAPCAAGTPAPPFQCQPPQRSHDWRQFARR
jgi:O-antigen ligase